MLPTTHLGAFLVTVYVLILVPGPSVLFVVSRGVALGPRAALATVLGNELGLTAQLALVTVGVGSILASSDAIYTIVKLAGAGYMVALGLRAIRDRQALGRELDAAAVAPRGLLGTIREGFLVGLTNPKGLLIFTAVLPQFIDRGHGSATLQLAFMGLICVAVALVSDAAWALAAGTARRWIGSSPRRLERLSVVGGASLIALAAALALAGRRD